MGLAKQALNTALDTTAAVAAVPGRELDLITEVEQLVRKVNGTIDAVDGIVAKAGTLVDRTANVVADAEKAVDGVRAITASASVVAERAAPVGVTAGRGAADRVLDHPPGDRLRVLHLFPALPGDRPRALRQRAG